MIFYDVFSFGVGQCIFGVPCIKKRVFCISPRPLDYVHKWIRLNAAEKPALIRVALRLYASRNSFEEVGNFRGRASVIVKEWNNFSGFVADSLTGQSNFFHVIRFLFPLSF